MSELFGDRCICIGVVVAGVVEGFGMRNLGLLSVR